METKLPIHLVTGFLGSGKSTFLQARIARPDFPRETTALIINDAGPMNVDAKVFKGKAGTVKALSGGCACCVVSKDLQREIRVLAGDGRIRQVWIEASGVAEVEDLLDRLTEEDLPGLCQVQGVLHLVDVKNYGKGIFGKSLERGQWRWADTVLLNKADLVEAAVLEDLKKRVLEVNPRAQVLTSVRGETEGDLLHEGHRGRVKPGLLRVAHAVPVSTCWISLPDAVDQKRLMEWLQCLPSGVYRVKGFVSFRESPRQLHLIHKVGEGEEAWQCWPYESDREETGLVFLGVGLEVESMKSSLSAALHV
ncbi:MAG: hypothetical protein HC904_02200 [Blastochloris sp.]|nr:hypothetical protein [Blastochloris sp.]